ncbi:hypothetical protein F750_7022 [Streptomyces sp. PAMC 26508]|nr:hypothetical protein F750_7022 [Streptomyces sp. PAMC 26508]
MTGTAHMSHNPHGGGTGLAETGNHRALRRRPRGRQSAGTGGRVVAGGVRTELMA